jgi:hypothetical protein
MRGDIRCVRCLGSGKVPDPRSNNSGGNQNNTPTPTPAPNSGSNSGTVDYVKSGDFVVRGTSLLAYVGTSPNVVIPNGIETIENLILRYIYDGERIQYYVLDDAPNNFVTSVHVPSSVRVIKQNAFQNSKTLRTVTFEPGLLEIEFLAFIDCPVLDNVVLPGTVTTIRSSAFRNCTGLTKITIPPSVTTFSKAQILT